MDTSSGCFMKMIKPIIPIQCKNVLVVKTNVTNKLHASISERPPRPAHAYIWPRLARANAHEVFRKYVGCSC